MTRAVCRAPGCSRQLWGGNETGVCRAHKHGDYCTCLKCRKDFSEPPSEPEPKFDPLWKTVHVPIHSTCSSALVYAPVTLPRAPWDVGP